MFAAARKMGLFDSDAFDDCDVAIDRQVRECFHAAAGLRPSNFQSVDFCALANAEDFAGIVRREIASAANLQPSALQIAGLPEKFCADGVGVGFLSNQAYAEPVVFGGGNIFQKYWGAAVHRYENVERAIIVEVTDGHAAG